MKGITSSVRHLLWPRLARAGWSLLALLVAGIFVAILVVEARVLAVPCDGSACNGLQLTSAEATALQNTGLSTRFYAAFTVLVASISGLVALAIAGIIIWRRSDDRMALFVSLTLLLFGVLFNTEPRFLAVVSPRWGGLAGLLKNIGILFFFAFLFLFPNGHFVPRQASWFLLFWIAYGLAYEPFFSTIPGLAQALNLLFFMGALVAGFISQVYRYRRVSTPLEKQQTRWFVLGVTTLVLAALIFLSLDSIFPALRGPTPFGVLYRIGQSWFMALMFALIPLTIGIAILRYRLWDIDILIRRTLVYGALTGTLAILFYASVVLFQRVLPAQSQAGAVFSTLLVAALFTPLRRLIQRSIDRRFYRRKYDAEKILSTFSAGLRDEVDLSALGDNLVRVIDETMQPEIISLWLAQDRPSKTHLNT